MAILCLYTSISYAQGQSHYFINSILVRSWNTSISKFEDISTIPCNIPVLMEHDRIQINSNIPAIYYPYGDVKLQDINDAKTVTYTCTDNKKRKCTVGIIYDKSHATIIATYSKQLSLEYSLTKTDR